MLSLNTSNARAMSPISSRPSRKGTATDVSPPDSFVIVVVMRPSGLTMPRPMTSARTTPSSRAALVDMLCISVALAIVASLACFDSAKLVVREKPHGLKLLLHANDRWDEFVIKNRVKGERGFRDPVEAGRIGVYRRIDWIHQFARFLVQHAFEPGHRHISLLAIGFEGRRPLRVQRCENTPAGNPHQENSFLGRGSGDRDPNVAGGIHALHQPVGGGGEFIALGKQGLALGGNFVLQHHRLVRQPAIGAKVVLQAGERAWLIRRGGDGGSLA